MKWGLETGEFKTDPLVEFIAPFESTPKLHVVTPRETSTLFTAVEDEIRFPSLEKYGDLAVRDRAILQLALNAGIRLQELSSLDLDNFDLSGRRGKVQIRSSLPRRHRSIPLPPQQRRILNHGSKSVQTLILKPRFLR